MKFNHLLQAKRPPIRLAGTLAAVMLLAACSTPPKLGQNVPLRSADSVAAQQSIQPQGTGTWPVEGWWRAYGDAQLDALIDEGLRNSPDVATADARLRRAAA